MGEYWTHEEHLGDGDQKKSKSNLVLSSSSGVGFGKAKAVYYEEWMGSSDAIRPGRSKRWGA